MTHLTFERQDKDWVAIYNEKKEFLGVLRYIRVGAWMSWCLMGVDEYNYFSASCLDEVRIKMKELNTESKQKIKKTKYINVGS